MSHEKYQNFIDVCIECATECNHCAVSCLEEKEVHTLSKCIRLNLECAVVCRVTAELMSLDSRYSKEICQLCAAICSACAEECEKHTRVGMEYFKECADICKTCAKEALEIYRILSEQHSETNEIDRPFIQQDECLVLSHATAELISLRSSYDKEISKLNATICKAYAEEFNMRLTIRMKDCNEFAKVAMDAYQELVSQDQKTNEANQSGKSKSNERDEIKGEANKKKKIYSRSLLSYKTARLESSLRHNAYRDGNFANIGTNLSYR